MAAPRLGAGKSIHPLARIGAGEKVFGTLQNSLGMISSMLFLPMMLAGGISGFISKKTTGGVHNTFDKVSKVSALTNANLDELHLKVGEIAPKAQKHVQKIGTYANKILGKDLAGRLGKVSTINAVQLGISGFSVANTARTFGDKIRILKHLHKDVTGREVSTMALLMGHNLPPIVKQARGRSLGLRAGLAAVLDVGLTGFTAFSMLYPEKQPKFMQKGFFANPIFQILGQGLIFQIPTMLIGAGPDPLQVYREAHLVAAQGKLPQEGYYMLIRNLAPDRMSDQEVAARAEQCFKESWSPQEVAAGMAETFGRRNNRPVLGPATARLNAESSYRQQSASV